MGGDEGILLVMGYCWWFLCLCDGAFLLNILWMVEDDDELLQVVFTSMDGVSFY